jgi:hypothetical protein
MLDVAGDPPHVKMRINPNLEVPMHLIEKVDTARADHYLAPFMGGRNATHFLADNRAGRTSAPVIPYERIGNKIYYRMRDLVAFTWNLTLLPASAVGTVRLRIESADDLPMVRVTKGAAPAIEIGWHPNPVTLSRGGAIELVKTLVAALKDMKAGSPPP